MKPSVAVAAAEIASCIATTTLHFNRKASLFRSQRATIASARLFDTTRQDEAAFTDLKLGSSIRPALPSYGRCCAQPAVPGAIAIGTIAEPPCPSSPLGSLAPLPPPPNQAAADACRFEILVARRRTFPNDLPLSAGVQSQRCDGRHLLPLSHNDHLRPSGIKLSHYILLSCPQSSDGGTKKAARWDVASDPSEIVGTTIPFSS